MGDQQQDRGNSSLYEDYLRLFYSLNFELIKDYEHWEIIHKIHFVICNNFPIVRSPLVSHAVPVLPLSLLTLLSNSRILVD